MNRITCEVCGTAFQDTSACCPICGWRPDGGAEEPAVDPAELENFDLDDLTKELNGDSKKKKPKRVFDFDAVNPQKNAAVSDEDDDTDYYASVPDEEEPQKTNVGLVVVLVIFIALVLAATVFLAVKFLIPGKKADTNQTTAPTVTAETVQTLPTEEETTVPTVPCTGLAMSSGVDTLTSEGGKWLLHVLVTPEDTTDTVEYRSEDESVVTVTADGCITAVGNGTTNVVVTCGDQTLKCPVTVAIEAQTEPSTEATKATVATEAATEATTGSTTLKLKKSDITFGKIGVYTTLELDCDLKPEDVKWRTSDSSIAMVRNGVVTAMGKGVAKITATYNGESVSCVVRVK